MWVLSGDYWTFIHMPVCFTAPSEQWIFTPMAFLATLLSSKYIDAIMVIVISLVNNGWFAKPNQTGWLLKWCLYWCV